MLTVTKRVITTVLILILAVAIKVDAQTSTAAPPASTPACVTACINSSLSPDGCVSITDLVCLCTNTEFGTAATKCIQANCTSAERTEALQMQVAECSSVTTGVANFATIECCAYTPLLSPQQDKLGNSDVRFHISNPSQLGSYDRKSSIWLRRLSWSRNRSRCCCSAVVLSHQLSAMVVADELVLEYIYRCTINKQEEDNLEPSSNLSSFRINHPPISDFMSDRKIHNSRCKKKKKSFAQYWAHAIKVGVGES